MNKQSVICMVMAVLPCQAISFNVGSLFGGSQGLAAMAMEDFWNDPNNPPVCSEVFIMAAE